MYSFLFVSFYPPASASRPLSLLCLFIYSLSLVMCVAGGHSAALSACLLLQPLLPPGSPASVSSPAVHNGTDTTCVFMSQILH